ARAVPTEDRAVRTDGLGEGVLRGDDRLVRVGHLRRARGVEGRRCRGRAPRRLRGRDPSAGRSAGARLLLRRHPAPRILIPPAPRPPCPLLLPPPVREDFSRMGGGITRLPPPIRVISSLQEGGEAER